MPICFDLNIHGALVRFKMLSFNSPRSHLNYRFRFEDAGNEEEEKSHKFNTSYALLLSFMLLKHLFIFIHYCSV